jgi:hypothetical protein
MISCSSARKLGNGKFRSRKVKVGKSKDKSSNVRSDVVLGCGAHDRGA